MSTEKERKIFGVGERGEVALITFEDSELDADGAVVSHPRYVVRMGAFTMQDTVEEQDAVRTARALVR